MAFMKNINDLIGILTLVVLALPSIVANIDCNGKPFHCVNSTHFMICVDLGSGVSSTIDDFVIPCPPTTVCLGSNRFECEFPVVTTVAASVQPLQATSDLSEMNVPATVAYEVTTSIPFEEYFNTIGTTTLSKETLRTQSVVTDSTIITDVVENINVVKPKSESNSTLNETFPNFVDSEYTEQTTLSYQNITESTVAYVTQNVNVMNPEPKPNLTDSTSRVTESEIDETKFTNELRSESVPVIYTTPRISSAVAENNLSTLDLLSNTAISYSDVVTEPIATILTQNISIIKTVNVSNTNLSQTTHSNFPDIVQNETIVTLAPITLTTSHMDDMATNPIVADITANATVKIQEPENRLNKTLTDIISKVLENPIENDTTVSSYLPDTTEYTVTDVIDVTSDIVTPETLTTGIAVFITENVTTVNDTSEENPPILQEKELFKAIIESKKSTNELFNTTAIDTNNGVIMPEIIDNNVNKIKNLTEFIGTIETSNNYQGSMTTMGINTKETNDKNSVTTPFSITKQDVVPDSIDNVHDLNSDTENIRPDQELLRNQTDGKPVLSEKVLSTGIIDFTAQIHAVTQNGTFADFSTNTGLPFIKSPDGLTSVFNSNIDSVVTSTNDQDLEMEGTTTPGITINYLTTNIMEANTTLSLTNISSTEEPQSNISFLHKNDNPTSVIEENRTKINDNEQFTTIVFSADSSTPSSVNINDSSDKLFFASTESPHIIVENMNGLITTEQPTLATIFDNTLQTTSTADISVTESVYFSTYSTYTTSNLKNDGNYDTTTSNTSVGASLSDLPALSLPILTTTETIIKNTSPGDANVNIAEITTNNANIELSQSIDTIASTPSEVKSPSELPYAPTFSLPSPTTTEKVIKNTGPATNENVNITEITTKNASTGVIKNIEIAIQTEIPVTTDSITEISGMNDRVLTKTTSKDNVENVINKSGKIPLQVDDIHAETTATDITLVVTNATTVNKPEFIDIVNDTTTSNPSEGVSLSTLPALSLPILTTTETVIKNTSPGDANVNIAKIITNNADIELNQSIDTIASTPSEAKSPSELPYASILSMPSPTTEKVIKNTIPVTNENVNITEITTKNASTGMIKNIEIAIQTEIPVTTDSITEISGMNDRVLTKTTSKDNVENVINKSGKIPLQVDDIHAETTATDITLVVTNATTVNKPEFIDIVNDTTTSNPSEGVSLSTLPALSLPILTTTETVIKNTSPGDANVNIAKIITNNADIELNQSIDTIASTPSEAKSPSELPYASILSMPSPTTEKVIKNTIPVTNENVNITEITTKNASTGMIKNIEIAIQTEIPVTTDSITEISGMNDRVLTKTTSKDNVENVINKSGKIPLQVDDIHAETTATDITLVVTNATTVNKPELIDIVNDTTTWNPSEGVSLSTLPALSQTILTTTETFIENTSPGDANVNIAKIITNNADIELNQSIDTIASTPSEAKSPSELPYAPTLSMPSPTTEKVIKNTGPVTNENVNIAEITTINASTGMIQNIEIVIQTEIPVTIDSITEISGTKDLVFTETKLKENDKNVINKSNDVPLSLDDLHAATPTADIVFAITSAAIVNEPEPENSVSIQNNNSTLEALQKIPNETAQSFKEGSSQNFAVITRTSFENTLIKEADNLTTEMSVAVVSSKTIDTTTTVFNESINENYSSTTLETVDITSRTTNSPLDLISNPNVNPTGITSTWTSANVIPIHKETTPVTSKIRVSEKPNNLFEENTTTVRWTQETISKPKINEDMSNQNIYENLKHPTKPPTNGDGQNIDIDTPTVAADIAAMEFTVTPFSHITPETTSTPATIIDLEKASQNSNDNLESTGTLPDVKTTTHNNVPHIVYTLQPLQETADKIVPNKSIDGNMTSTTKQIVSEKASLVKSLDTPENTFVDTTQIEIPSYLITENVKVTNNEDKNVLSLPNSQRPVKNSNISNDDDKAESKIYRGKEESNSTTSSIVNNSSVFSSLVSVINTTVPTVPKSKSSDTVDQSLSDVTLTETRTGSMIKIAKIRRVDAQAVNIPNLSTTSIPKTADHKILLKTEVINVLKSEVINQTKDVVGQTPLSLNGADVVVMTNVEKQNTLGTKLKSNSTYSGITVIPDKYKSEQSKNSDGEAENGQGNLESKQTTESVQKYTKLTEPNTKINRERANDNIYQETGSVEPKTQKINRLDSTIRLNDQEKKDTIPQSTSIIDIPTTVKTVTKSALDNVQYSPPSNENHKDNSSLSSVNNDSTRLNLSSSSSSDQGENMTTIRRSAAQTKPKTNTHNTSVPVLKSQIAMHSDNFVCDLNSRGRYSDTKDCKKFYICIGKSQPINGFCPNNTVFSEIRKQCTKNLSHCMRNNQFQCVSEGRFSDYLNDNIYYICVKNNVGTFIRFKLQCQSGYHLNKTSVRCVLNSEAISGSDKISKNSEQSVSSLKSEKLVGESSKTFECKKSGRFPDPIDCRKYYVCTTIGKSQIEKKVKKCDSDEIFHKDKKKCVDADSYECS